MYCLAIAKTVAVTRFCLNPIKQLVPNNRNPLLWVPAFFIVKIFNKTLTNLLL